MTYAVGTGGALNLELAANELEGALGSAAADTLLAGSREDGILLDGILLDGNGGNDTLSGGLGDDWLAGGVGADTISAGVGNDTILFDAADLAIDGGDGFDTALVSGSTGVTLDLGVANIESAVGGDGADTLYTNGTARVILSGGGNDTLTGGQGSDLLTGGAGTDEISGRLGNDLYVYIRGDGADTVNDNGGLDTLEFGDGIALSDLDAERAGNDLILGLRDWAADGGTVAGQMSICRTPHRRAKVSRRDTAAWARRARHAAVAFRNRYASGQNKTHLNIRLAWRGTIFFNEIAHRPGRVR